MVYEYGNELSHYGVLGMHWGVRRYQNTNGSYTNAGKKRKREASQDYTRAKALKKKSFKELSNTEMAELNRRKELEANYKRLNPSTYRKAMRFVALTAADLGTLHLLYKSSSNVFTDAKNFAKEFDI